ncbi:hypothetical protein HAX54_006266, partial [Datura stramonium]|nr:hypothetical protein [Datura stramonium]
GFERIEMCSVKASELKRIDDVTSGLERQPRLEAQQKHAIALSESPASGHVAPLARCVACYDPWSNT